MPSNTLKENVRELSKRLYAASKSVRILRNINWPIEARETFFKNNCTQIPKVSYATFDPSETLERVNHAKKLLPECGHFADWGNRIAHKLEQGAYLLQSLGTPAFFTHSRELYGAPMDILPDGKNSAMKFARHFEKMYDHIDDLDLDLSNHRNIQPSVVHDKMKVAVQNMFGEDAPKIQIEEQVSSNVIAGRRRIRIRSSALFSDLDIDQLIHHEAYIHVATSLNGYHQKGLKILAASHPGTTKTQEGLAVFSEFISGAIDLDRFRRLSDRILAVQMAIDGANFMDVFRYYREKIGEDEQAFESTRRVFRGGVITGGAPFTKDIVYLEGLLRVHNFLRIMVSAGRADLMKLLFVGKLDLNDLTVLKEMERMGLLKPPKYLPPWMSDMRFLLTYLSYSNFLNTVDLGTAKEHYLDLLK
jgi:uncharacterized protein (TIGR02421 family)